MTDSEIKQFIIKAIDEKLPDIVAKVLEAEAESRIDGLLNAMWNTPVPK